MSNFYYKIRCGEETYYYPGSLFSQEDAMEKAREEFGCEPVFEGIEYA